MSKISKIFILIVLCFHNNINANDSDEIALACYDEPIDNLEKTIRFELLLTRNGFIDGLNHTNGRIDVNTAGNSKWYFTGNYYSFNIFGINLTYYADENIVYRGRTKHYCVEINSKSLRTRLSSIKASKRLFQ